jgi:hypothetical protein
MDPWGAPTPTPTQPPPTAGTSGLSPQSHGNRSLITGLLLRHRRSSNRSSSSSRQGVQHCRQCTKGYLSPITRRDMVNTRRSAPLPPLLLLLLLSQAEARLLSQLMSLLINLQAPQLAL